MTLLLVLSAPLSALQQPEGGESGASSVGEGAMDRKGEEARQEREDEEPVAARREGALVESVEVTAEFLGDTFSPESISTAVLEPDETVASSTMVEAATALPGVSENGQAGIFQVLSVRGISRQRLLTFLDGARITSERRAGVSASFVDPSLMGQIEVSRGPASTYYGSGALGGAIQLFPETYAHLEAEAGWQSQGDEVHQRLAWGDGSFSLGLAHRQADDAETAAGDTLFGRFEQTSATARATLGERELAHTVSFAGSYGSDIGKANNQFPQRTTIYPRERHGILRYQVTRGDRWRGRLWTHGQDLLTDAFREDRGQRNVVESSSLDLGGLFEHRLPTDSSRWDGRVGVDYFGRRDVTSEEDLIIDGTSVDRFSSLDGGQVDEAAGYGVVNWTWADARFEVGGRWTESRQSNAGTGEERSRSALTGFVGAAFPVTEGLEGVVNLGRGLRFPSLSEQFFFGTTGRGTMRGNPDLGEETSTNLEAALRWQGRTSAWTASAFRNEIDDYIERIELGSGDRGFVNLESGRILGVEVDGFVALGGSASPWRLDASGHWIDGEAEDGSTLADVPPSRIRTSLTWAGERWSARGDVEWRASKDDFGPAERAIPSAWVLDGSVRWSATAELGLVLQIGNALDEEYFPAADAEAPMAAGRSVGLSVSWTGSGR